MKQKIIFQEKQRFTQWWLWLIIILANVLFVYTLLTQEIIHTSTGESLPDYLVVLLFLLPVFGVSFFYLLNLKTEITREKIYFRFFPFHLNQKEYLLSDIQQMKVVEYSPIRDYGGWGIRYSIKGKAFNVKGNKGLLILFKDGTKRLIGTQKQQELQKIITELGF